MILVVDDEEALVNVIASVLEDEGYPVVAANDGATALAFLRRHPTTCLAFLDLMMPGMDGWQLRRAMLAEPSLATIPVVIVSALVTGDMDELRPAAVLGKPFKLDHILDAAQNHCRG